MMSLKIRTRAHCRVYVDGVQVASVCTFHSERTITLVTDVFPVNDGHMTRDTFQAVIHKMTRLAVQEHWYVAVAARCSDTEHSIFHTCTQTQELHNTTHICTALQYKNMHTEVSHM